jgi:hypothetical protein
MRCGERTGACAELIAQAMTTNSARISLDMRTGEFSGVDSPS